MQLNDLVERYAAKAPVALLLRGLLDYTFAGDRLDALFEAHRVDSYTRHIGFPHLVALLTDVVFRVHPSVRAAYRHHDVLPAVATLKSFYDKLNHSEPAVAAAFVEDVTGRVRPLLERTPLQPEPVPGLRLLCLDGNHLEASHRRLQGMQGVPSPLPGQAMALLEYTTGLLSKVLPWEDAHSNERALHASILPWFGVNDCVVADSIFCTEDFMRGLIARKAFFIVRHHGSVGLHPLGLRQHVGSSPTGEVYEYRARYAQTDLGVRVVEVELKTPTREGHTVIRVLSNLTAEQATALQIAAIYLKRRRIETVFQELEQALESEVNTLAYPRAALLAFCVAAAVYNVLQVVRQRLEQRRQQQQQSAELSATVLAQEVRAYLGGLSVALEGAEGMPRGDWSVEHMEHWLQKYQGRLCLRKYAKARRGEKKPRTIPHSVRKDHHGATARILELRKRGKLSQ